MSARNHYNEAQKAILGANHGLAVEFGTRGELLAEAIAEALLAAHDQLARIADALEEALNR